MSILYFFFRTFAWVISHMPFPLLYLLSGVVRLVLQTIIRYRRKTVLQTLCRSFPEKSRTDILKISRKYYKNLADVTLEVIKLQAINKEDMQKRFTFTGLEHMEHAFHNGRSVIVAIGHCGNWEWMGTALGMIIPVKGFAIVKPLAEKKFNNYLESLRHRFNPGSTIPFQHTYRSLIRNRQEMVTFNVIAADQTPTRAEINYWSRFLNQDTPFYLGVEKLARSLDFSVVFMDIHRTGRGKYTGDIHLITHEPKKTSDLEITEQYIRLLEDSIVRRPDNWLWSHRRWKFQRDATGS